MEITVSVLRKLSQDLSLTKHPFSATLAINSDRRSERRSRTAYVKGFPSTTHASEIRDFFHAIDGSAKVKLRRYLDANTDRFLFKGSVFVTFASKERCQQFVDDTDVYFKELPLLRYTQNWYYILKQREHEAVGYTPAASAYAPGTIAAPGAAMAASMSTVWTDSESELGDSRDT